MSGRGGSGSFGSGRTAGYAIGEGRTSPWLEAIAGRDPPATVSQAGLQARAGSPDPSRGTCKSPSGSHRRDGNEHPLLSARKCVRGRMCGASSQAGLLYLRLGQYLGVLVLGNLGNLVLGNLVLGNRAGCMLGIACVRAGQSVQDVSLVEPCYFAHVGTTLPLVE